MNDPLPDRVVIAVIALTVILVFAMAFALKPRSDDQPPFLWRDESQSPPGLVSTPSQRATPGI